MHTRRHDRGKKKGEKNKNREHGPNVHTYITPVVQKAPHLKISRTFTLTSRRFNFPVASFGPRTWTFDSRSYIFSKFSTYTFCRIMCILCFCKRYKLVIASFNISSNFSMSRCTNKFSDNEHGKWNVRPCIHRNRSYDKYLEQI